MTQPNKKMKELLAEIPDDQLMSAIDVAYNDCKREAEIGKGSEAHQESFAGLLALVFEAQARGHYI